MDFIIVALDEYRQVFPKSFHNVFGLILPYKAVLFVLSKELEQRRFFLGAQSLKGLYFASKFRLIHGDRICLFLSPIPHCDRVYKKRSGYLYRCSFRY